MLFAVKFFLEMQLLPNSFVNIVMNTILEVRLWNLFWKLGCENHFGYAIVKPILEIMLLWESLWKCCCGNDFGNNAIGIFFWKYCCCYNQLKMAHTIFLWCTANFWCVDGENHPTSTFTLKTKERLHAPNNVLFVYHVVSARLLWIFLDFNSLHDQSFCYKRISVPQVPN